MDRITKCIDDTHACYAICEKECPDGIYADNPACVCTASKIAMKRLLEYEDTGLTPEQIRNQPIAVEIAVEDVIKIIRAHLSCENDPEIKRSSRDNDGWIPVEDRLPKENGDDGELIVTDKDGRIWSGIYYGITEETDEYPCFHKWDEEMWYCYKPDVIAWRPLPEPYRQETETEKPDWRQDMLKKFDRRD